MEGDVAGGKEDNNINGQVVQMGQNPLHIPEIAAMVAGLITEVNDLKSVRCLGKFWRDETFQTWRNTAVFLLNEETVHLLSQAFADVRVINSLQGEVYQCLPNVDEYKLRQVPFKRYRFTPSQCWTYPLQKYYFERNLIWTKIISPYATYLDVGACFLWRYGDTNSYRPGLVWVLRHCPNVTELSIAPIRCELASRRGRMFQNNNNNNAPLQGPSLQNGLRRTVFTPPKIQSVTIATPTINEAMCRGGIFYMEPLFVQRHELDSEENCQISHYFIATLLPNLKSLCMFDGGGASAILTVLARTSPIQLESINVVGSTQSKNYLSVDRLATYLSISQAPLRELQMSLASDYCVYKSRFFDALKLMQSTLTKLELLVNCNINKGTLMPSKDTQFYLRGCNFPNLTEFKAELDYEKFQGKLPTFDLNNLRQMPKLQKFHFGMKKMVAEAWVKNKLSIPEKKTVSVKYEDDQGLNEIPFDPILEDSVEKDQGLSDLKRVHFHGNLTQRSLHRLAKWTENMETLELVMDSENMPALAAKENWAHLKNLTLLPCSFISKKEMQCLQSSKRGLHITNKSTEFVAAETQLHPFWIF